MGYLRKGIITALVLLLACSSLGAADTKAKRIRTTTTNFNNVLSATDTEVQASLDTIDNNTYTQTDILEIVAGGNFDFFLNDTASGVGAYYTMAITPTGEAKSTFSDEIASDDFLIDSFITPVGEPTFTTISAGLYNLRFQADVDSVGAQVDTIRIYYKFYEYDADTTETLIATSFESDILTETESAYNIYCIHGETTIESDDRLLIKIYAAIEDDNATNADVNFYAEGVTATRFIATTKIGVFDERYVEVAGDTMTGALTINNLTLDSGSITDSGGTIDFGDENLQTTGTVKINKSSVHAFKVEDTGTKNSVLHVDTDNGRVGINTTPTVEFEVGDYGSPSTNANFQIIGEGDTGNWSIGSAGTDILTFTSGSGNYHTDTNGVFFFGSPNTLNPHIRIDGANYQIIAEDEEGGNVQTIDFVASGLTTTGNLNVDDIDLDGSITMDVSETVDGVDVSAIPIIKSNWGYVPGDGDSSCQETVTFASAFSSIPDVTINCLGYKDGTPSNRGDVTVGSDYVCTAQDPSTTSFTAVVRDIADNDINEAWDITTNQIAHYPMNDDAASTDVDDTEDAHEGTLQGGDNTTDLTATGKINAGLHLDGNADYIDLANESGLRFDAGTQDFSIFAWVKRDVINGKHFLIDKRDGGGDGYLFYIEDYNQIKVIVGSKSMLSTSTVNTDWHHIGVVIDRDGNGQVWIDGSADGDAVAIGGEVMATTATPTLGKRSFDAGINWFDGIIDDLRIFDKALTSAEIGYIYNGGSGTEADTQTAREIAYSWMAKEAGSD